VKVFAAILSLASGLALAFAFRASKETKGLVPWYKWGPGTGVAFNRGVFGLGVAGLVAGNVIGSGAMDAVRPWVLWSSEEFLSVSTNPIRVEASRVEWTVDRAYRDQPECEKAWKNRTLNLVQEPGRSRRYVCLPDTVDPRGPKGTTR